MRINSISTSRRNIIIIFVFIMSILSFAIIHSSNPLLLEEKPAITSTEIQGNELQEKRLLYNAFRKSGAQFKQLQVNGWTKVNKSFNNRQDARSLFEKCLKNIPFIEEIKIIESRSTEVNDTTTFWAQGMIDRDISARLTMIFGLHDQYLILALAGLDETLQDEPLSDLLTTQQVATLLGAMPHTENISRIKNNTSLIYMGTLKGEFDRETLQNKGKNSIAFLKSNKMETLVNDHVVSVSGYSPKLSKRLTVDGKSVNINMAFRYNSVENMSLVYLGTPIITSEY